MHTVTSELGARYRFLLTLPDLAAACMPDGWVSVAYIFWTILWLRQMPQAR